MMSRNDFNHVDWYNRIATTTGGYRKTWTSTLQGRSGERVFEETLFGLLEAGTVVLDAGCGSGEFTLEVARRAGHVTGFDFAEKMVEAAENNFRNEGVENATFVHSHTRELPFAPESFDLVYSRRGPTSVILRTGLLGPGGWMIGVHSERLDLVRERLAASGLSEIEIDEFEAVESFPTVDDFAAFWTRVPGHPDYLAPENAAMLELLTSRYSNGNELSVPEYRFVWRGKRTV